MRTIDRDRILDAAALNGRPPSRAKQPIKQTLVRRQGDRKLVTRRAA